MICHVVDFCLQHLGADITAGGKVVGDCVECPFHQWRFEAETGKCVQGPTSDTVNHIILVYVTILTI